MGSGSFYFIVLDRYVNNRIVNYFFNSTNISSPQVSNFSTLTFTALPMLLIFKSPTIESPFPKIFGLIKRRMSSNNFFFINEVKIVLPPSTKTEFIPLFPNSFKYIT